MKRQFQVTIRKVDNGYIVQSQSDAPGSNIQKIATTPGDAKTIATEMITAALAQPESQPQ